MRTLAALAAVSAIFLLAAAAASASAPKGSRAHPYPMHTWARIPGGWALRVNGTTPDATQLVVHVAESNFHPKPGWQYFMINVTLAYSGSGKSAVFSAYSLSALGRAGLTYTALDNGCGVVPKAVDDFQRVPAGRRVSGNICFAVLQTDARVLRLEHRASPRVPAVFFRLR